MSFLGWLPAPLSIIHHPLFLFIAAVCSSWILILRPRLSMIPLGVAAYLSALVIEYYLIPLGYGVELLFIAPLVEESMKFIMNRSRSLRGGMATGWAFSIMENTTYFVMFASSPIIAIVVMVRSLSDTMMHSFNTGLSSFSYGRGKLRMGLPAAIAIHALFNLGTVLFASTALQQYAFLAAVFCTMAFILVQFLIPESRRSHAGSQGTMA